MADRPGYAGQRTDEDTELRGPEVSSPGSRRPLLSEGHRRPTAGCLRQLLQQLWEAGERTMQPPVPPHTSYWSLCLGEQAEAAAPGENNSPRSLVLDHGCRRRCCRRPSYLRPRPSTAGPAPANLGPGVGACRASRGERAREFSAVAGVRTRQGGEETEHGSFYFSNSLLPLVFVCYSSHTLPCSPFLDRLPRAPHLSARAAGPRRALRPPSSFSSGQELGSGERRAVPALPYGSCSSFISPRFW